MQSSKLYFFCKWCCGLQHISNKKVPYIEKRDFYLRTLNLSDYWPKGRRKKIISVIFHTNLQDFLMHFFDRWIDQWCEKFCSSLASVSYGSAKKWNESSWTFWRQLQKKLWSKIFNDTKVAHFKPWCPCLHDIWEVKSESDISKGAPSFFFRVLLHDFINLPNHFLQHGLKCLTLNCQICCTFQTNCKNVHDFLPLRVIQFALTQTFPLILPFLIYIISL